MHSLLITAHTGADGTPDNSLEYVRYALTTNADTLEVDIRPIDDGTLVISHDEAGLDTVPLAEVCHANGIRTINIHQWLVTRRLIEVLAKEGIGVSAWTVNEPAELEWFLQSGVANITTRSLRQALTMRPLP